MDQNNQNPQNQSTEQTPQVPTAPVAPAQTEHQEPVTTVMQPADAQPVVLPVEGTTTQPQPTEAGGQTTPAAQTAAPDAPQAEAPAMNAPSVTADMHTGQMPTQPTVTGAGNQPKRSLMMIVGVFIVVMLIAGGAVYVIGSIGKTQRLGMYTEKSLPANTQKTTVSPTPLPEEKELNTLETGDPETN